MSIGSRRLRKCAPATSSCSIDREKMTDRAGEAIEPDDDQGIAAADVAEEAGEHWAGAIGAGGVLLEDFVASGGAQFVALGVRTLIIGGDPGIADEPAGEGGGGRYCHDDRACSGVRGGNLQFHKGFGNGRLQRWPRRRPRERPRHGRRGTERLIRSESRRFGRIRAAARRPGCQS